jgi:hypothetical protein
MRLAHVLAALSLAATAVVVACVGEDPSASPGGSDAGADGARGVDGGGADGAADALGGPRCNPSGEFQAPQELAMGLVGDADDLGPRLSPDEKTLYLSTQRLAGGRFALARGRRAGDLAFAVEATPLVRSAVTGGQELSPSVSGDGKLVVFSAVVNPDGGPFAARNLYYAEESDAGAFGTPMAVLGGIYSSDDADPYLVPDRSALWVTFTDGAGIRSVHRLRRGNVGESLYTSPQEILAQAGVSFAAPVVSPDERTLFAARATGAGSDFDIVLYSRSASGELSGGGPIVALNKPGAIDVPTWVSPDGCALYFTSNRMGPMRSYVSYRAR